MYRDSKSGIAFHDGMIWRSAFAVRFNQSINVLFNALYLFLAVCFLLEYLQVRRVPLLDSFAEFISARFSGIVHEGHDPAGRPIAWFPLTVFAVIVLVHASVVGLIRHMGRSPLPEDD